MALQGIDAPYGQSETPAWLQELGFIGGPGQVSQGQQLHGYTGTNGTPQQWWMSGDQAVSHSGMGDASQEQWALPTEYRSYADSEAATAAHSGLWSRLNGTNYDIYDAATGEKTGTGIWEGLEDSDNMDQIMMAVVGAALGGIAAFGGAGGVAGAAEGGGVAGVGDAGWGMGLDSVTGGSGAELLGGGAASGGGSFIPGVDSQLANQTLGLEAVTGATPPAQYLPTADPSSFVPGVDSQAANEALGLEAVSGPTNPAIPTGSGSAADVGAGTGSGTGGGTTTPPTGGIPSGGGDDEGGLGIDDLLRVIAGYDDRENQRGASEDMLNYLKERQAINDNMYKPGSTEYNALWDEMSRKDAAAGRNSQYGPRSVDLGARIAQLKMDANTKMTTGIGSLYKDAINQGASSNAGLWSSLAELIGDGGDTDWGGLIDTVTDWFD